MMFMQITKITLVSFFVSLIVGCASTPQYQINPTVPKAFVESAIDVPRDYNDSTAIMVYDNKKLFNLFYINSNKVVPEGSISVEANKPLKFSYRQAIRAGDTCSVDINATLEPNKRYAFVGGTTFTKSIIPFLPDRGCEFGLQELGSGKSISD